MEGVSNSFIIGESRNQVQLIFDPYEPIEIGEKREIYRVNVIAYIPCAPFERE